MDLAKETTTDLLRSCWLIEASRKDLFARWGASQPDWSNRAELASRRADLLAQALAEIERKPDLALLDAHAAWLRGVVGEQAGEVPLGALFAARLGDWVENHVAGFIGEERRAALKGFGDKERSALRFPDDLPSPPPFEPIQTIDVDPPGQVRFRFAILGDLHFGSPQGDLMAEAAIADVNASGADLVIQLGDITDHGFADEFAQATAALSKLQVPCTTMMGNHDVVAIGEQTPGGRDLYGNAFGREADGVLFEHKGIRFAVLDSATHSVSPFAPFNFVTGAFIDGPGGALVHGSLTVPQHEILADVAEPGSPPAFVFLHHPPQPFAGFPPLLFGLRESDSGRLHATADSGNVWGIFAGHTHRIKRTTDFGRVPVHEVAIARDYPFGYSLVDVTDQGYRFRFVQLSDQELLRKAYESASTIHRRYGIGSPEERSFIWTKPGS